MAVLSASDLVSIIMEAAEAGVRGGLEEIQSIAKEMAPVRSIYAMTKNRNAKHKQSMASGSRYVALSGKAARMSGSTVTSDVMLPGGRSVRTGRSFQRGTGLKVGPSSSRVRGRSNSTSPVIKTPYGFVGGKAKVGGKDARALRRVKPLEGGGFELAHKEIRIGRHAVMTSDLLSARGRYEVKSGRAKTSGPNGDEIGGTLRDSIRIEGPFVSKRTVSGYVSAYAENDNGLNYGYFMEFGSRHNQPHPFLRPALWAATDHGQLAKGVVVGIKGAKITTGQSAGGITLKAKVKLDGFDQLKQQSVKEIFPADSGA